MKKLLITLILVLFALPCFGADKLMPEDFYSLLICAVDSTGTYAYGYQRDSKQTFKIDTSGTITLLYDFDNADPPSGGANVVYVKLMWITSDGTLFVLAWEELGAADKYYIWKSTDGGVSYGDNDPACDDNDYYIRLGDTDGTVGNQLTGVEILSSHGFCEATVGGSTMYLFAEYNGASTAACDLAGPPYDNQVRLLKSADGITWTAEATWNTDGVACHIRHLHGVIQGQYGNQYIYIFTGDGDNESSIIVWDGITNIPDNHLYSELSAPTEVVAAVGGAQRYRSVDIIQYTDGSIFTFTDDFNDAAEKGIWHHSETGGSTTRVDSQIDHTDEHEGGMGLLHSSGAMIFTEYLGDAADERVFVYVSDDGGTSWTQVATVGYQATKNVNWLKWIYEFDDNIFAGGPNLAGKDGSGTIIFDFDGTDFDEDDPIILHPVTWVASTGTDSTADADGNGKTDYGDTSRFPLATLEYAMESDHICAGTMVYLTAETFGENATWAKWDLGAYPGTGTTVVRGRGRSSTTVNLNDAANASYLFYCEAAEGVIRFEKLNINSLEADQDTKTISVPGGEVIIRDCTVSNTAYAANSTAVVETSSAGVATIERSVIKQAGTAGPAVYNNAGTMTIKWSNIINGNRGVQHKPTTNLTMYNCSLYGYSLDGLWLINAGGAVQPTVKNCVFGVSGADAIDDDETIAENAIDYNCYYGALQDVTDGGHSLTTTNPQYINVSGDDLRVINPLVFQGGTDVYGGVDQTDVNERDVDVSERIPIGASEWHGEGQGNINLGM